MSRCWACHGPHKASERPECIEWQREYYRRPEVRERQRQWRHQYYLKNREKILQRLRKYAQLPHAKEWIRRYKRRPEVLKRNRDYMRNVYTKRPEYLPRHRAYQQQPGPRGKRLAYNKRRDVRDSANANRRTSEFRERRERHREKPEVKERERLLNRVRRRKRGILSRRQTRPEAALERLLHLSFPGDWRYTGQGDVVLARLVPDFFNQNGKKAIIELYGCYHHNCPACKHGPSPKSAEKDARRLQMFEDMGFKTLVVWEHELKAPESVVDAVREKFYGGYK